MVKIVGTGALPEDALDGVESGGASWDAVELSEMEREGAEAFKRWKQQSEEKKRKRDLSKTDPVD